MDVVHRQRLPPQLRLVVIVDVAHLFVQQVEHLGGQREAVGEAAADLQVEQRRGFRADAAILDQGPGTEVAQAQAAEPGAGAVDGDPRREGVLDGAGDVVSHRIEVGEAGLE